MRERTGTTPRETTSRRAFLERGAKYALGVGAIVIGVNTVDTIGGTLYANRVMTDRFPTLPGKLNAWTDTQLIRLQAQAKDSNRATEADADRNAQISKLQGLSEEADKWKNAAAKRGEVFQSIYDPSGIRAKIHTWAVIAGSSLIAAGAWINRKVIVEALKD